MSCSLKFMYYLHYQCHMIYCNHFLKLMIKANITVSYTPLFVGLSGDSSKFYLLISVCHGMSNGVLLSCRGWHEDEGARLEGAENQALRVHGSPCLSQQGTVVTSSSLSLVPSSPSLSVCDSTGLWAAEVSAGRQRGDCVSALPACVSCKRSPLWQEQPSHFIWVADATSPQTCFVNVNKILGSIQIMYKEKCILGAAFRTCINLD